MPNLAHPAVTGPDLTPEPDANWSLIAADFASLGCEAETFPLPPGMSAGEYGELTALMTAHAAAGVAAILAASKP